VSVWVFRFLKLGLAVLLAWYVLSQITWHDSLESSTGEVITGTLSGDWQGQDWTFNTTPNPDFDFTNATPRPGLSTLFSGLQLKWYLSGIGFWIVLLIVVAWRWKILLHAADVQCRYWHAMRLCFVGYFFNNVMPGLTGGDVVRAVIVARGVEQNRARAAISVFVDRAIGLVGLLIIGAAILFIADFGQGLAAIRLVQLRFAVLAVLAIVFLGAYCYLSKRMRKLLRIETLLAKLPLGDKIEKIDDAITVYRQSPSALFKALSLSIILQAAGVMCFWSMGQAIGASLGLIENFAIYPVVQTISSLPLAPAGWGIGESLYGRFFNGMGSTFTLGVAVSILFRLTTQVGFGLLGGLAWAGLRSRNSLINSSTPLK